MTDIRGDAPTEAKKPSVHEGWEERFLGLEREGATAKQIAEAFGVTARTVSRWRTALNVRHAPPAVPRPESDRHLAWQMIQDGCPLSEVAETLNVSQHTLRRWFPGLRGWSRSQAGAHAALLRKYGRVA